MKGKPTVAIVGYGKVGKVLTRALIDVGYSIAAVVTRQPISSLVGVGRIIPSPQDLFGAEIIILCLREIGRAHV